MRHKCAALLAVLALAAPPAAADRDFTLKPSAAVTATGTGAAVDVSGARTLAVHLDVTAGSGTVTVFRVFLEGSADGTNFTELLCDKILEAGGAAPGAATATNQRDVINKVAVVTSLDAMCTLEQFPSTVRAQWVLTGTTPSETFAVRATGK